MKKALSLLSIFVLGFIILTGQKYQDNGPRWTPSTVAYPKGNYVQLPSEPDRFVSFSNGPRYIYTPQGVLAVNPSVRVLPSTTWNQSELYLASNKANRNILFGSSNNVNGSSINSGCFVSTDNGLTWGGYQQINSGNTNDQRGDPGPMIDKNMRFLFSHLVSSANFSDVIGIGANYSTNYGANWSSTVIFDNSGANCDKNLSNSDDSPSSPYYGYSYTAWCYLGSPASSRVSRTTNGGVSWDSYITLASSTGRYFQGHDVATGPNGEVYVVCNVEPTMSPWNGVKLGVSKSTNGGASFSAIDSSIVINGARDNGSFGGWSLRVNDFPRIDVDKSGGAHNGWIYIVDMQKNLAPAGSDEDVIMYRSSNQGATWMPGVRVNQDALNNGKRQFFPAVKVDDYGGVNVIYYDNRNFPNADSATVMVSRSIDGGATFTDFEITDHHFKPKSQLGMGGGYMGDYIGLAIGNNKVYGFWMDDKAGAAGFYNAWTASFDLGPSIVHTPLGNTEQITGSRPVNCVITPAGSPITPSTVKLYYSLNNPTLTSNVTMTNSSGNNWTANLPLSGAGTYRYYITATDGLSRTATYPAGAPANTVQFLASTDTIKPVITHIPINNTPKTTWPVSVSANVTDNIGIDSVWVRWYKNNTGLGVKVFKLPNTSGSTYSALFNSLNSDVAIGDSIFYRVIAQDNSSGHNRDSTALNKFTITNVVATNVCITKWIPIRDNVSTYDSVQVGTHSNIIKVNFTMVNLIHTYDGDVTFALRSPNGTEVVLTSNNGGSGDNYTNTVFNDSATTPIASGTAPFTGTFIPTSPLSAFNGQDAYGWWRFRVTDNASGDTGHVGQYCIQIYSGGTLTGINNAGILPTKFELSQNYPNPFNPTTKINFAIPKQGLVTMKIYDVLGREVRTLVNEVKPAGNYSVDFNASELSSGVYFYRVQSGDFSDIKRMILIK
ncbi:MAG: T9SS type A sorting domain-containing protein [Ignavibacteria bacterium]|nr:T9SS type A sorting domain-containing protein [Ignavibacteria bacterium]